MNNTTPNDWQNLLAGFSYQSNKLLYKNSEVLSAKELTKFLYTKYKNESLIGAASFQLNDFTNKILTKIYPESINKKWQIKKINTDDHSFIIRKAYTERGVTKENCIPTNQTSTLSLDSEVDTLLLKASYDQQNRHIWLYGKFYPTDNNDELIRYYFNFSLNLDNLFAFEHFLCLVMNGLNERGISFQLKFLDNISHFKRADSMVIYIEKFHYLASFECIKQSYLEVKPYLIEPTAKTPLFTHKIADGWGFAEEPKTKETNFSFGQERTNSIAKFIWDLEKTSPFDINSIFQSFKRKYRKEYDFDNFHLNHQSIIQIKRPTLSANELPKLPIDTDYWVIKASNIIGFHLCRQAIWGSSQSKEFSKESLKARKCTWLNAEIGNNIIAQNINTKDFYLIKSVDAGLGNGLAGILYFLVKLYGIQKSDTLLNTIHGAANNLFSKYDNLPNSLFNGKIGVLLVLNELSKITGFDGLAKENIEKVKALILDDNDSLDFYDGLSGQIWALVVLYINTSDLAIKNEIKTILLAKKDTIIKKTEEIKVEDYKIGLNGLSGIILMLVSFTIFLFDVNMIADGQKSETIAVSLLSKIAINKLEDNNIELGWSGVLIALIAGKARLANGVNYDNLLKHALLKVMASFLAPDIHKNYSVNSGFLSTILSLSFYENFTTIKYSLVEIKTAYLEDFMQKIYTEILQKQNLPPLGLSKNIDSNTKTEYYNSGVLNGISGIGLMFLKMRSKSQEPMFFFDQILKPPHP